MLSVAGASSGIGAAAGAISAAIAYFRLLEFTDARGVFWAILLFQAGGGALAGAVAAEISRKLPPAAFAFLAALLPAGLEHLGSFAACGNLTSTALTQYMHPSIVKIARLGGLSAVTYTMFLFGGAVAAAVRYAKVQETAVQAAAPPVVLVMLLWIFGAASGAAGDSEIYAGAYLPLDRMEAAARLAAEPSYDKEKWTNYLDALTGSMGRAVSRSASTTAAGRRTEDTGLDLLVLPEASMVVDDEMRETFLGRVGKISRTNRCVIAVGYYDITDAESAAALADADSGEAARSSGRRCYIGGVDDEFRPDMIAMPVLERPGASPTSKGSVATILSIDANFFANFRSAAGSGAEVVCVLGYDDEVVPQAAVKPLVFNAAMSGLPVVRSTQNGRLAIIDPDGDILEMKHTTGKADCFVHAVVPTGARGTIFLSLGNAFAWLAILGGLVVGLCAVSLKEPEGPSAVARESDAPSGGPISYRTRHGVHKL
jgi:apolipoprotein N-acyltransferase